MSARSFEELLVLFFLPHDSSLPPASQPRLPRGRVFLHTAETNARILLIFEDCQQGVEEAGVLLCLY